MFRPMRFINILRDKKNTMAERVRKDLFKVKRALSRESEETKEMLQIYRRFTMKQASKEEMKVANEQFVDLLRSMGIGIFAVLPFAPITIPIVVKLGQKFGINILPSSFRDWSDDKDTPSKDNSGKY